MSAAVNLFLNKSVLYSSIPFELSISKALEQIEKEWESKPHIPNKENLKAFKEAYKMIAKQKNGKRNSLLNQPRKYLHLWGYKCYPLIIQTERFFDFREFAG